MTTDSATGRRNEKIEITPEIIAAGVDAVEILAEALNWKQEQLDPSEDGGWAEYTATEKEFFRNCIRWLAKFPKEWAVLCNFPDNNADGAVGE